MAYGFYNVTLVLNGEQERRLEKLEKRLEKINGWDKQGILQFAIVALSSNVDSCLALVENEVDQFELK